MIDLAANLSALGVNAARAWGAASNLANMNTPGYKAVRVESVSARGGGVTQAVSRDNRPGPIMPDGVEGSNVDPALEIAGLITAKFAYSANAKAIAILDETKGFLLDIVG